MFAIMKRIRPRQFMVVFPAPENNDRNLTKKILRVYQATYSNQPICN